MPYYTQEQIKKARKMDLLDKNRLCIKLGTEN